jgi:hypothetical protein
MDGKTMDGSRGAAGVGLLVEERREAIAAAWGRLVEGESAEPALAFAVAPLLREMSLVLRRAVPSRPGGGEGWTRCAVLVRSTAQPARIAREFRFLRRAIWEVLRAEGHPILPDERRAADEWLDEALERSLERIERARLRIEALERGPVLIPPKRPDSPTPPPLPSARRAAPRPPPASGGRAPALQVMTEGGEPPLVEADLLDTE